MSDNGVELATAYVSVVPSMAGFDKKLREQLNDPARKSSEEIGDDLERGIGQGASRGVAAAKTALSLVSSAVVLNGLNRAKDAASGLQQAVGGTAAVFGEFSDAIDEAGESSAQTFGLSERQFREFTSQIGAGLKGYGFAVDEAADKSIELVGLGADLSATFGGTVPDAMTALSAALRGEFDPLERYGIALRQSSIDARAVSLGLAESETNVSSYARAQAALTLITEQAAGAQGQFAREADTAAGQAAIATAEVEDAAADLGEALLPITAKISEGVAGIARVFSALPDPVQTGIVALAGIAAVAGPVSNAVALVRSLRPATEAAAEGLTAANRAIGNSAEGLEGLYSSGNRGSRALRGLAVAGGVLAAVGIAATLYEMGQASSQLELDIEGAAQATTDELVTAIREVQSFAGQGAANDFFRQLAEGGEAGAAAAVELRDAIAETGQDVSEFDAILTETADGQAVQAERSDAGADALARFRTEATDAAPATRDFTAAVEESEDPLGDLNDELSDAVDNLQDYFAAQSSGLESQIAFRDVLRGLLDTQEEVAEGNLTGQERYDELAGSVIRGRDRILEFAQGLIETGTPLDEVIGRVNSMTGELFDAADQAGLTAEETAELREQLGLMPDQVRTTVETNLSAVTEDMQAFTEAVAEALQIEARVRAAQLQSVTTGDRRARADGGPVAAGQTYLVGEEGPEFFTAAATGFVTPMDVFGAASAAPGGGEIHLHVTQLPGEDQVGAGMRALRHLNRTQELVGSR